MQRSSWQQLADSSHSGSTRLDLRVRQAMGDRVPVDLPAVDVVVERYGYVRGDEANTILKRVDAGKLPSRGGIASHGKARAAIGPGLHQKVLTPAVLNDEPACFRLVCGRSKLVGPADVGTVTREHATYGYAAEGQGKPWRFFCDEEIDGSCREAQVQPGVGESGYQRFGLVDAADQGEIVIAHQITRIGVWALAFPTVSLSTRSPA